MRQAGQSQQETDRSTTPDRARRTCRHADGGQRQHHAQSPREPAARHEHVVRLGHDGDDGSGHHAANRVVQHPGRAPDDQDESGDRHQRGQEAQDRFGADARKRGRNRADDESQGWIDEGDVAVVRDGRGQTAGLPDLVDRRVEESAVTEGESRLDDLLEAKDRPDHQDGEHSHHMGAWCQPASGLRLQMRAVGHGLVGWLRLGLMAATVAPPRADLMARCEVTRFVG